MTTKRRLGFTLIELLVAIAILGILAAISFPVFRMAVEAAKTRKCLNNFAQIGYAMQLYTIDWDDRVTPVNYRQVNLARPEADRTWVQTLVPYAGSFELFQCPADTGRTGGGTPSFVNSNEAWKTFYNASLRSNLGFNYMYLSPLVQMRTGEWRSFPIQLSSLSNQSNTLMFIDSLWDRSSGGLPFGGGSWVVVPPCRFRETAPGVAVDTFDLPADAQYYFGFVPEGWQPESSQSWLTYGGAWPWHRGKFNMLFADGRAKTVTLSQLLAGCDFQEKWRGLVKDADEYIWDTQQ